MEYELVVTPKGEYQLTHADSEVLSGFFAYVDEIKEKEKKIKEELEKMLEKLYLEKGINNIDSKEIKITFVPASTTTKFDTERFKKEHEELYNQYLGGIIPLDKKIANELTVFSEKLAYDNLSIYHDGVKLEVDNNYLVPVSSEGMVIFIGEKENYGNVIIIEDIDGVDTWYGNIETTAVKLYDYVTKGSYLGTTKGNYLYLVYQKDGEFLDYKSYLK